MNGRRRETPGDESFLFRLYATTRAWELDAAGIQGPFRDAFLRQQFEAMTLGYRQAYRDAERWVLECDGQPVGSLVVHRGAGEIRVVYLAVLPEFQGRGIGRAALKPVQADASAAGLPLHLQVLEDSPAREFYRRLGFTEIGRGSLRVQLEWRAPPGP